MHNVENAVAAIAATQMLGVNSDAVKQALTGFKGIKRRFEYLVKTDKVVYIDDYAHHPTEVRATLAAAKSAGYGRVWVVFQPHRYSRTQALGEDFGGAFDDADRVVLMDVYSAGEAPIPGVSGKTVVESLLRKRPRKRVAYFPHRADVAVYVAAAVRSGDLVMTMGAGDVTTMGPEIMRAMSESGAGESA